MPGCLVCGCFGATAAEMSGCCTGGSLKYSLSGPRRKRFAKSFLEQPPFQTLHNSTSTNHQRFCNFDISAPFAGHIFNHRPVPRTAPDTQDRKTGWADATPPLSELPEDGGDSLGPRRPPHSLRPWTLIHRLLWAARRRHLSQSEGKCLGGL